MYKKQEDKTGMTHVMQLDDVFLPPCRHIITHCIGASSYNMERRNVKVYA